MVTLADQKVILETQIRPIIEKSQVKEITKSSISLLLEAFNANVYASDGTGIGTEVSKFLDTFVEKGTHENSTFKTLVNNKFVGQPKRSILRK